MIFAEQPLAERVGPDNSGLFRVYCNFTSDEGGTGPTPPPTDLSTQVAEISWGRSTFQEPTDINVTAKAIRNAAGDQYNPKPVRRFSSRTFTIYKWFPVYPIALADEFEEAVNLEDWKVSNSTIVFHAGTIMCLSIMPTSRYAADAELLEVAFTFERKRRLASPEPFQFNVVNQGRYGWWKDTSVTPNVKKYGPITAKTKDSTNDEEDEYSEVSEDVLLDDTGKPIDTTLFIGKGNKPDANPNTVTPDAVVENAPGPARIHIWRTAIRKDFSPLSRYI